MNHSINLQTKYGDLKYNLQETLVVLLTASVLLLISLE